MAIKRKDWEEILEKALVIKETKVGTLKNLGEEYNVSPATISRKLNQHIETFDMVSRETITDIELGRIAKSRKKLKEERTILGFERRYVNKDIRNHSISKEVIDRLNIEPIIYKQKKFPTKKENLLSKSKVILLSDFHYEREGDLKELGEKVIKEVSKGDLITILLGGDYIENKLHQDQLENKGTALEQTMDFSKIIIDIVDGVYNKVGLNGSLSIKMVAGNHDRVSRDKTKETREDTYAYIIFKVLKRQFPKISIDYNPDRVQFTLPNEEEALLTHGNREVRNSDSLDQWLSDYNAQNVPSEFKIMWLFAGHFHKNILLESKKTRQHIVLMPSAKDFWNHNKFEEDNNLRSITGFTILTFEKILQEEEYNTIYKFIKC